MTRTQIAIVVLAVVGVAALAALRPRRARPLEIGDRAPGFTLPAFSAPASAGSAVRVAETAAPRVLRLDDYRQQVVLVNFWASWCPPCVEEAASLENFAE